MSFAAPRPRHQAVFDNGNELETEWKGNLGRGAGTLRLGSLLLLLVAGCVSLPSYPAPSVAYDGPTRLVCVEMNERGCSWWLRQADGETDEDTRRRAHTVP